MTKPKPPAAPPDLGKIGRAVWRAVVANYELRPDELRILGHAARVEDVCARLSAEVADAPLTVPGSKGQAIVQPLLQELRLQQALLATLYRQLAIPDADGASIAPGARSSRARAAAIARWSA